jgi:predicted metal-dependent hydrolase
VLIVLSLEEKQERRKISELCKQWAYKIAKEKCHVIFHKLPKRKLGTCYKGFWKLRQFGMRSFKRNIIVLDIEKTKERGYDIEELVIHECMHLKHDGHTNEFACEMKRYIGRHEWQYATKKPIGSLFVGDEKVGDITNVSLQ